MLETMCVRFIIFIGCSLPLNCNRARKNSVCAIQGVGVSFFFVVVVRCFVEVICGDIVYSLSCVFLVRSGTALVLVFVRCMGVCLLYVSMANSVLSLKFIRCLISLMCPFSWVCGSVWIVWLIWVLTIAVQSFFVLFVLGCVFLGCDILASVFGYLVGWYRWSWTFC